jgi:sRNA-binding protein
MFTIPAGLLAFAATWWRAAVGFVAAAPLFFLLGQCDGRKSERSAWEAKIARNQVEAERKARAADEQRRAQQARDEKKIADNRKEVDDATAPIPDQAPSARQRARACLELRRQAAASGSPPPAC